MINTEIDYILQNNYIKLYVIDRLGIDYKIFISKSEIDRRYLICIYNDKLSFEICNKVSFEEMYSKIYDITLILDGMIEKIQDHISLKWNTDLLKEKSNIKIQKENKLWGSFKNLF